jgi:hypothetical protein
MHLIRRGPHSDFGAGFERQTFLCPKCNVEIERSADKKGQPHAEPSHLMARIARNIELYNSAYRLAWKHVSEPQKREQPNIAQRLHDSIKRQLSDGATEPLFIASEALKALGESERGTQVASES